MNCVAAASSNNGTFGFLFAATAGDRALAALLRASGHMQNYDVDDSWAKVQLIVTNP